MSTIAKDIMSKEVLSVRPAATVEEALKILVNARVTGVPVVDAGGQMVGIYSDYELIEQIGDAHLGPEASTRGIPTKVFHQAIKYSSRFQSVAETTSLSELLRLLVETKYRRLFVLSEDRRLSGIISRRDLMKLFYYRVTLA